jgi:hypothetical protein
MDSAQAVTTLAGLRAPIGAGAWLMPRVAGRLFGLDVGGNPQAPYLARLFGIRDLALAAGAVQSRGEARRLWLRIGIACDAADAAAGLLAGRAGYLPKVSTVLVTVPALAGIALGVIALRGETGPGAAAQPVG